MQFIVILLLDTVPCQVGVTFSTILEQLSRTTALAVILWGIRDVSEYKAEKVGLMGVLGLRAAAGIANVAVARTQFAPVCFMKPSILGPGIAQIILEGGVITYAVVRIPLLLGLFQDQHSSTSKDEKKASGYGLFLVTLGFGGWWGGSIPYLLGVGNLAVRIVPMVVMLLVLLALLRLFPGLAFGMDRNCMVKRGRTDTTAAKGPSGTVLAVRRVSREASPVMTPRPGDLESNKTKPPAKPAKDDDIFNRIIGVPTGNAKTNANWSLTTDIVSTPAQPRTRATTLATPAGKARIGLPSGGPASGRAFRTVDLKTAQENERKKIHDSVRTEKVEISVENTVDVRTMARTTDVKRKTVKSPIESAEIGVTRSDSTALKSFTFPMKGAVSQNSDKSEPLPQEPQVDKLIEPKNLDSFRPVSFMNGENYELSEPTLAVSTAVYQSSSPGLVRRSPAQSTSESPVIPQNLSPIMHRKRSASLKGRQHRSLFPAPDAVDMLPVGHRKIKSDSRVEGNGISTKMETEALPPVPPMPMLAVNKPTMSVTSSLFEYLDFSLLPSPMSGRSMEIEKDEPKPLQVSKTRVLTSEKTSPPAVPAKSERRISSLGSIKNLAVQSNRSSTVSVSVNTEEALPARTLMCEKAKAAPVLINIHRQPSQKTSFLDLASPQAPNLHMPAPVLSLNGSPELVQYDSASESENEVPNEPYASEDSGSEIDTSSEFGDEEPIDSDLDEYYFPSAADESLSLASSSPTSDDASENLFDDVYIGQEYALQSTYTQQYHQHDDEEEEEDQYLRQLAEFQAPPRSAKADDDTFYQTALSKSPFLTQASGFDNQWGDISYHQNLHVRHVRLGQTIPTFTARPSRHMSSRRKPPPQPHRVVEETGNSSCSCSSGSRCPVFLRC